MWKRKKEAQQLVEELNLLNHGLNGLLGKLYKLDRFLPEQIAEVVGKILLVFYVFSMVWWLKQDLVMDVTLGFIFSFYMTLVIVSLVLYLYVCSGYAWIGFTLELICVPVPVLCGACLDLVSRFNENAFLLTFVITGVLVCVISFVTFCYAEYGAKMRNLYCIHVGYRRQDVRQLRTELRRRQKLVEMMNQWNTQQLELGEEREVLERFGRLRQVLAEEFQYILKLAVSTELVEETLLIRVIDGRDEEKLLYSDIFSQNVDEEVISWMTERVLKNESVEDFRKQYGLG